MKRLVKSLLTLALLLVSVLLVKTESNTVLAAETDAIYKVEQVSLSELEDDKIPMCTDTTGEWLFAGWYQDESCETAYSSFPTAKTAYAKFVPEKVLSVKLQLTEGTYSGSDKTNMRLVSSVDSLNYRNVGFNVYFNGAKEPVPIKTSTVYKRIVASAESGVDYNYSPKVVDVESEYFVTATLLNIAQSNFEKSFYIRPYWETLDGTVVYGENRYVTVEDGYDTTIINMPVKMSSNPGNTLTVGFNADATVSLANYDGTYAHVRIKLPTTTDRTKLASLTKVEVSSGGSVVGSDYYRNLLTTHVKAGSTDVNADKTWYQNYETESKFVIATSADLYGLTQSGKTFSEKQIYVVADIEANVGRADTTDWLDKDKEGNTIEGFTNYLWTSISNFTGVFDGQMHEISGIYLAETNKSSVRGLFATTSATTVIRNLKLINSYFESNGQRLGSIVGEAFGGTLKTVYSDAIVNGSNTNTGGLVGRNSRSSTGTFTMKNCWYAGTVNGTGGYAGGLMGSSLYSTNITHCLNTGNVTGIKPIGGLVSNADGGTLSIINSMNSGSVSGSTTQIGGIVGLEGTQLTKATYDSTYMTDESATGAVNGAEKDGVTSIAATKITGIKALTATTKALFSGATDEGAYESYWAIVNGGTPVLASFKEFAKVGGNTVGAMAIDTSWYNDTDTEFILSDAADLYGLAFLSQTNNFDKKKIKLNKDITINEGMAANWDTEAPSHNWFPIGRTGGDTQIPRFAGIFDGQMHTISGVYMKSDKSQVGMFGNTNADAVIKNLKLVNSYFETEKDSVGSIAGYGYGTFDTIYSDAIVKGGSAWIGGLIGLTHGGVTTNMDNCWFDGEVFQTGEGNETEKACVGGLIGLARNVVTISNCLSTGEISSAYTSGDPCVGGLVGRVTGTNAFTLKNSFDAGIIQVAETATSAYGPIAGSVETTGTQTITDNLAYSENYKENVSTEYKGVTNVSEDDILGTDALKEMPLLFTNKVSASEYASCWAVVVEGVPVLESFADVTGKEYLAIDTSWYNGDNNYVISDASDLYGFVLISRRTNYSGATISIDEKVESITINEGNASSWKTSAPKYEWISIGSDTSTTRFAGTFNGNMKSIEGVYLNTSSGFSGLFSATAANSVIQNLNLKNSYMDISGSNNGSIVGRAYGGTFDTVYSDAVVIGDGMNLGGLVGQVPSAATETIILNNCWFAGSVTNNTKQSQNTGGLFGTVLNVTNISNCLNTGAISMPNYTKDTDETEEGVEIKPCVGGFAGNMKGVEIHVENCFNAGVIKYPSNATNGYGTFAGYAESKSNSFENSYSTIENGLQAYARGCDVTLKNVSRFNKTSIYGTNALSYMMDLFTYETEDGKYKNYWSVVPGKTPILTSFASQIEDEFLAIDTSWYDGTGSYALYDVADFYGFTLLSYKTNFADETITLEDNIVVNEGTPCGADGVADIDAWKPTYEWVKIGSYDKTNDIHRFNGTFDGKMHSISGIYLQTGQEYSGLFGLIDTDGVVKNFSLLNSYFNCSGKSVGSIAGHSRGTIETVYSNAVVIGSQSNVGGILGQVDSGGMKLVNNCWFDGEVTNTATNMRSTGGLIGSAGGNTTLTNSLNTGHVSAPNFNIPDSETDTYIKPFVGGLIGYAPCTITLSVKNCLNTGDVSFKSVATTGFGSIIGRISARDAGVTEDGNVVIENTYATSQSCWQAVSSSSTWSQVQVTVVDENVIGGENAKEILSGLFDDNLTTSWVVGAEYPVLKDFATYANTEKSISALHKWVSSSNTLTATLANPITLPNPDQDNDTFFRQGGYTDGRYFYQAYIVEKDTVNDEQGNKVKVLKYDLTNPDAPVVWSEEQALRHANDVTFNSKLGYLVVCHGDKNISYFDITDDSLDYVSTVEVPYSISRIAYNEERDVYVTGTSTTLYVLNSDLQVSSSVFQLPAAPEGGARQSVSCDNDYLYYAITDGHASGDKIEQIEVYDWCGKLVTTVTVTIDSQSDVIEFENISVVGDKLYIMAAEYSTFLNTQIDKPANVYVIDKSVNE